MNIAKMLATGGANFDMATGIVYGFHYPNTAPYIHETMMNEGEDITYRDTRQRIVDDLSSALEPVFERHIAISDAEEAAEQIFDDYVNDHLEIESDHWYLKDEEKGLELELTESSLVVIKSPVIAWVAECSICAPNGGDLENPREEDEGGIWSYCLPEDFFEDEEYPYHHTMKTEDYVKKLHDSEDEKFLGYVEKVLDHNADPDEVAVLKKELKKEGFSIP